MHVLDKGTFSVRYEVSDQACGYNCYPQMAVTYDS